MRGGCGVYILLGSIAVCLSGTINVPDDNDELPTDTEPANDDWTSINLWPGGIVYYELPDTMYTPTQRGIIVSAMRRWEAKTCVEFLPWRPEMKAEFGEERYIKFFSAGSCFSENGMAKGQPQLIGIGRGCLRIKTVIHELGHALGLVHTMERPDRDLYIKINYDNMNNDSVRNFDTTDNKKIIYPLYGTPYDYKSIMHYGPKSWSVTGKPVTVSLDPAYHSVIGRALDVSFFDALYINTAYNCTAKCIKSTHTHAGLCRNGGFLGGKDCRCICHDGYSGQFCDQMLPGVNTVVDWRCQKNWIYESGRCNLYNTDGNMTYSRAQLECSSQNSTLITFKTRPDMEWLSRLTREALITSGKSTFWVGAKRDADKTDTTWADNSLVDTNLVSLDDKSLPEEAGCAEYDGIKMTMTDCHTVSPSRGFICQKPFDATCGGRYIVGRAAVTIQSPGFPNRYGRDLECQYIIQTKINSRIRIKFPVFMLEPRCKNDYLEVKKTNDVTASGQRFCNRDLNKEELITEGNLAVLTFRTNGRITSVGFKATLEIMTSEDGEPTTTSPFNFLDSIREVFRNVDNTDQTSEDRGDSWTLQTFIDLIKSMTFSKVL